MKFEYGRIALVANNIDKKSASIIGWGQDPQSALLDCTFRAGVSPSLALDGYAQFIHCSDAAALALGNIKHLPGTVRISNRGQQDADKETVRHVNGTFFVAATEDQQVLLDFDKHKHESNKRQQEIKLKLKKAVKRNSKQAQVEYGRIFHEINKDARSIMSEGNYITPDLLQFPWGMDIPFFSKQKTEQHLCYEFGEQVKPLPDAAEDDNAEVIDNAEAEVIELDESSADIMSDSIKAEMFANMMAVDRYTKFIRSYSQAMIQSIADTMSVMLSGHNDEYVPQPNISDSMKLFTEYHKWSIEAAAQRSRQLMIKDFYSMDSLDITDALSDLVSGAIDNEAHSAENDL
jgi:hypothetical protein